MALATLRQKILEIVRDKKFWALIIILGVGAYLRLWHIDSLFNYFEEFDEATTSLHARFISEGFLPYKDFTMIHPPLYYLVLAAVYKIFGYSLFYAKYMSILLSLASIVLLYLAGKKLYHTGAGLAVACFFAISPDMVYMGRRVEQESLGIFLVILAIYCIAHFIANRRGKALIFAGLALGLALATKYTFLPIVMAVLLALVIYLMGEDAWKRLKLLAKPSFILAYVLLTVICLTIVYYICRAFNLPVSVSLFDYGGFSTTSIILACCIFILALFLTLSVLGEQIRFREWWGKLVKAISRREVWYLASGILLGFIAITGYFWIRFPQEFYYHTISLTGNRLADFSDFPSSITLFRGALGAWEYLKIAFMTGLLSLPVALLILNKKNISHVDYFAAAAIIITVVFCQFLGGTPRYYYSVYPLLLLGLASFVPGNAGLMSADIKTLAVDVKMKLLAVTTVAVVFLSTSFAVITDFSGYDYGTIRLTSGEQYIYEKTINYLESVSPNKVYTPNPIFIALSSELDCNLDIDAFALLRIKEESAEQLIQENIDQGADYFVLDYWARGIFDSETYDELEQAISQHARLVQVIGTSSISYVEIYQLVPEGETILNGDFSQWARGESGIVPHAWHSVVLAGESGGDVITIAEDYKDGKQCIRLGVEENGLKDGVISNTYCRIYQTIPFSEDGLIIDIMPTFNADTSGGENLPEYGIVFISEEGVLTITFSDAIDTEQFIMSDNGNAATVIRPAELRQWSEESIDLAAYWAQAGWETPDEMDISFFISAHYTSPGTYDLYIAKADGK